MIVVTGANGHLGRGIAEQLVKLVGASRVGVSVRDPEKAQPLAALGVRVRRGDFTDAASLRSAFEGAAQVLIVSSAARATGGDPIEQHRTAIEAAKAAGVKRILYTGHMAASPTSAFFPARDHASTEVLLRASGMPFTFLRNGFYANTAVGLAADAMKTGELVAPLDGPVSWTSRDDLAEAAAIILSQEGRFDGLTPPLTAAQALDLKAVGEIASQLSGGPITRVTLTDAEHRERSIAKGMPARAAEFTLSLYLASRAGEFAAVDPTLEHVLGRKPTSMRELISAERRPL